MVANDLYVCGTMPVGDGAAEGGVENAPRLARSSPASEFKTSSTFSECNNNSNNNAYDLTMINGCNRATSFGPFDLLDEALSVDVSAKVTSVPQMMLMSGLSNASTYGVIPMHSVARQTAASSPMSRVNPTSSLASPQPMIQGGDERKPTSEELLYTQQRVFMQSDQSGSQVTSEPQLMALNQQSIVPPSSGYSSSGSFGGEFSSEEDEELGLWDNIHQLSSSDISPVLPQTYHQFQGTARPDIAQTYTSSQTLPPYSSNTFTTSACDALSLPTQTTTPATNATNLSINGSFNNAGDHGVDTISSYAGLFTPATPSFIPSPICNAGMFLGALPNNSNSAVSHSPHYPAVQQQLTSATLQSHLLNSLNGEKRNSPSLTATSNGPARKRSDGCSPDDSDSPISDNEQRMSMETLTNLADEKLMAMSVRELNRCLRGVR